MGWNGVEDSTYLHAGIVSDLGVAQHEVLLLPLRLQSRVLLAHLTLLHWDVMTCAIELGTLAGQIVRGFLINMYKGRGRRAGGEEGRRGGGRRRREEGRKGGGEEGKREVGGEEGRRGGGRRGGGRRGGGQEGKREGGGEEGRRGGGEEGRKGRGR